MQNTRISGLILRKNSVKRNIVLIKMICWFFRQFACDFFASTFSKCPKISLYYDCGVCLFAGEVSWTDDVTGEVVSFTYTANENGYSAQVSGIV